MQTASGLYSNAVGYESYMGRWSAKLAPSFLSFACRHDPETILDVGCGTGSLLRAAAETFPHSTLVGIDPYLPFVKRAQATLGPALRRCVLGRAEDLPFADDVFDHCLSLLVLQELRDYATALAEQRRITRAGGVVAACQWDFESGMPMLAALREALAVVDPALRDHAGSARAFTSLPQLETAWRSAGFDDVETSMLTTSLGYADFTDLWLPVLAGSTPTTAVVAALPMEAQQAVAQRVMEVLAVSHSAGGFSLTAHAFAVRGRAPN
jgi:ubiquinone/menaquinone biosynthesis C-methylase UbiE